MILPEVVFTFAWDPRISQKKLKQEAEGLIWTPESQNIPPDPYLVHFSRLTREGREYSWLWLFPTVEQAIKVKVLPEIIKGDRNLDPIVNAMPKGSATVVEVATSWLNHLDPEAIQEVWWGFNHRRYYADRDLPNSTENRFGIHEWADLCRKKSRGSGKHLTSLGEALADF